VRNYEFLTKTEREILKFLAQGLTMEDILEKMCIAQTTFKSHLNDIFQLPYLKWNVYLLY